MPKRKKEEDQILLDVTDCGIKGAATLRISHGKYNKKRGTLYTAYLCNSDSEALLLDAGLKKNFKRVQKWLKVEETEDMEIASASLKGSIKESILELFWKQKREHEADATVAVSGRLVIQYLF